ncbi:MAG TPA: EamA family transporter [candidate division Zixibacteria bacterium]|nr:EamA family transporter [candidate division Zixibacteria bacterium]
MAQSAQRTEIVQASKSSGTVIGYLCIAAATLFWGVSATLGRAVFTGKLRVADQVIPVIPPQMLAQSRTSIAALVLICALLLRGGPARLRMSPRDVRDAVILGIFGVAGSNFFYYYAIQQTTVATAIIMQYMAPVFVLLYMVARGFQHATAQRVVGVAAAVLGSVLAIGVVRHSGAFPWLVVSTNSLRFNLGGVAAALIAAVAFSFYNIYGRELVAQNDRWRVLTWALTGAGAFWLFLDPPWKIVAAHYSSLQWGFMGVFSISSILIPFSLYFLGLHYLDATRAIVTSCLEPVFSIAIAAIALGETVSGVQIAGIIVVLSATVVVQLPEKQQEPKVLVEPIE